MSNKSPKENFLPISAYLPCYNNESTILRAIESLRSQTVPISELFVVDDCSTDQSVEIAKAAGVRVIANTSNKGRGAIRAQAMMEASHELVLGCDAGVVLSPNFIERALSWMDDDKVAGVQGHVVQPPPKTAVERWRGRHLFKVDAFVAVCERALLTTAGCLLRKSSVLSCGNYRKELRHGEDKDLGARLLAADYKVIIDPTIRITDISQNDFLKVLERYSRWHANQTRPLNLREYARLVSYSIKVMAASDIRAGDITAAAISLCCPHFQFWRSHLDKERARIDFRPLQ
jgi:glycosyltransferase involved in cell wall biosynthesis